MDQIRNSLAAAPTAPRVTAHARARMQQRGIRSDVLEALLDFGSARHLRQQTLRGGVLRQESEAAPWESQPGLAHEAERLVRTYAIVGSNGVVVTVGHRYRRVESD